MAPHRTSEAWQDVRGTGYTARVSLDVARGRLAALLPVATAERVPLVEAIGRVSAEAVLATRDVPHLPSARIDGYPLAAAATFGASAYNPLPLNMGVRAITAGAPMPPSTDAVLPFMAAAATGDFIEVVEPVAPGDGVELAGAVWQRGAVVLPAGRRLSALDIACAASAGLREIPVRRRPHIGLSAAGPKGPNEPGGAWTTALASLVARDGGVLSAEMRDAADLQLLHGRTGCGMDDAAAPALIALGQVMVHGIAIAPGGSAGIGYH
jgi:molybdopterin molybdotransferase